MKRNILVLALSVLAVTACGKKEAPVAEAPAPAPVRSEAPKAEAAASAAAPAEAAPAAAPVAANDEEKVLNIYNWADYIPADMVANFEKESGIKVNYQTFENNEGLHAKLVAGNSGFDLVVPGAVFAKSQIDGGQLGMQAFVVLEGLVINLDARFLLEIGHHIGGNVVRPVVDVQHLFFVVGGDRCSSRCGLGGSGCRGGGFSLRRFGPYRSRRWRLGHGRLLFPTSRHSENRQRKNQDIPFHRTDNSINKLRETGERITANHAAPRRILSRISRGFSQYSQRGEPCFAALSLLPSPSQLAQNQLA
jgi:hypothetical protein